ncbi:MAG: ATP-dependent helicase, partial [Bacteroidetes bacterium]
MLDAASSLIAHNRRRLVNELQDLGIRKRLRAGNPERAELPARPRVLEFPNRFHEEAFLLEHIRRLHESGFPLEEAAVLFARHRQSEALMDLLEKSGIPYQSRRSVNLLDEPLIANLRMVLSYLVRELRRPFAGEDLLPRLLHFPFWGLPEGALVRLAAALQREAGRSSWRAALLDAKGLAEWLTPEDAQALHRVGRLLEGLLEKVQELPILRFLELLLNQGGVLAYVLEHPQKDWHLHCLHTLLQFVEEEAARNPRLGVEGLLEVFERMDEHGIPLETTRALQGEGGIHLLTAHSAKGLEFRKVFLLGCTEDQWGPAKVVGNRRFHLPDTLTWAA